MCFKYYIAFYMFNKINVRSSMSSNEIAEVKNYSAWILQKKGLWMQKPKRRN